MAIRAHGPEFVIPAVAPDPRAVVRFPGQTDAFQRAVERSLAIEVHVQQREPVEVEVQVRVHECRIACRFRRAAEIKDLCVSAGCHCLNVRGTSDTVDDPISQVQGITCLLPPSPQ